MYLGSRKVGFQLWLCLQIDTVLTIVVATSVLLELAREINEPEPFIHEDINEAEINYLIKTQQIEIDAQVITIMLYRIKL